MFKFSTVKVGNEGKLMYIPYVSTVFVTHFGCCLVLKAFCKAGSYSPTGLEPCISCEKGFYQVKEGQKGCLKCITTTTTPGTGSTTSKECRGR